MSTPNLSIDERARAAVAGYTPSKRADASFAYFGDLPLGETYARTFGVHRDSDSVERSNWRVISADLLERFPDDCEIERSSHWAVGWTDELTVRMLDDTGHATDAARAVFAWLDKLENYPVANDEDHSELQCEDEDRAWDAYGRREFTRALEEALDVELDECTDDAIDILWSDVLSDGNHYVEHDSSGPCLPIDEVVADLTDVQVALIRALPGCVELDEHGEPIVREPVRVDHSGQLRLDQ